MKNKTWIAIVGLVLSVFLSSTVPATAQEKAMSASVVIEMVNINTADVDALSSLPGIGTKKAESIIAYRELNGEFSSVEELVNVKGIGKGLLSKLATRISV